MMDLPNKGGSSIRLPSLLRFRSKGRASTAREKRQARLRWLVMGLIGLFIIIIEVIDHYETVEAQGIGQLILQDAELIREIVMFGIFAPLIGGLLLTLINRTGAERDMAVEELDHQRSFLEELFEASCWEDLIAQVLSFPSTVVPATFSILKVFDKAEQSPNPVTVWGLNGVANPEPLPDYSLEHCQSCQLENNYAVSGIVSCPSTVGSPDNISTARYCLPLTTYEALIGVLNFDLPEKLQMVDHQQRMLTDAAPQIALAIENAQLQRAAADQADVATAERQRIARNLHDTLAQNISYLRLKLDQLSTGGTLQEIAAIQLEIERMREVADDAYTQVRQTLADLYDDNQVELSTSLRELAQTAAARSDFEVQFESQGRPVPLSAHVKRQALSICREALNNIEKHARATLVSIQLFWERDNLAISITDDGRGFMLEASQLDKSFGMIIMYERSKAIDGELLFETAVGEGTTVTLTFPLEMANADGTVVESLSVQGE